VAADFSPLLPNFGLEFPPELSDNATPQAANPFYPEAGFS